MGRCLLDKSIFTRRSIFILFLFYTIAKTFEILQNTIFSILFLFFRNTSKVGTIFIKIVWVSTLFWKNRTEYHPIKLEHDSCRITHDDFAWLMQHETHARIIIIMGHASWPMMIFWRLSLINIVTPSQCHRLLHTHLPMNLVSCLCWFDFNNHPPRLFVAYSWQSEIGI